MVRPLKGRKRVHNYAFTAPGEFDDYITQLRAYAFSGHRGFSDLVLESLLEYGKQHRVDAQAPELKKQLKDANEAIKAADETEIKLRIRELIAAKDLYKRDPAKGLKALERSQARSIPTLRRTRSPRLLRLVEKAGLLTRKALSKEKRLKLEAAASQESARLKVEVKHQEQRDREAREKKAREEFYKDSPARVKALREQQKAQAPEKRSPDSSEGASRGASSPGASKVSRG